MKAYSQRKKISVLLVAAILTISLGLGCGKKDKTAEKKKYLSSAENYFKNGKYAEAIIEYKNALKYTPKSSVVNYKLFKTYLKQKNLQNAFPFLLATLKYDPDNRDARFSLAEILLLAKKYDNALKEVEKLLKTKPNDWRALNIKGTCFSLKGQFDKALSLFKESTDLAPKEFTPYMGTAGALIRLGRASEAWKSIEQAEKIKPGDISLSVIKAEWYKSKKDFPNMEKELIKVTKRSPGAISAFIALANYYASHKEIDKARDIVARAMKVDSDNTDVRMMDARLSLMLRKTEESLNKYKDFIKKHPKNSLAVNEYVLVLGQLKRFDKARKAVDAFERVSVDSSPREALGKLMMLSGRIAEAEKAFRKAIKVNKKSAIAYYSLSDIYMQRKEFDKAKKFLDKGLLNAPESVTANILLSKMYLAKKDIKKARKEIARLKRKFPKSPTTLNLEARLAIMGDRDVVTAERKLRESTKINPRNPRTMYLLGKILMGKKDWGAAEEIFAKLVKRLPLHVDALRGLVQIYYKTGQQGKAFKMLSERVKKHPKNYDFKILLAKIYYRNKNKNKSVEILRAAKALYPERISAPNLLAGILTIDGNDAEALKEYRYVLDKKPGDLAALFKYLEALKKHKGIAEAEAEAEKIYKTNKSRKGVSELIGRIKFEEGKFDEAKKYFYEALKNNKKSASAYYGLGEIALGRGESASAKKYFSEVLELFPGNIKAAAKLGHVYVLEGNIVGAEKELSVVKKQAPGSPLALNLGAYINMKKGNLDEAEKELRKSLVADGKNYRTLYAMARLFMAKKEWKKSLDTFLSIQKIAKTHIPTVRGIIESYRKMGQTEKGMRFIIDIVKKNQKNYELKIILARMYHTAKNDKKAIDTLNEAKRLNPALLGAPSLISRILVLNRQYKRAEQELLSILTEHPRYIPALLELGKIGEYHGSKQLCLDIGGKGG